MSDDAWKYGIGCPKGCECYTCAMRELKVAWAAFVRELLKAVEPVVLPILNWLTKLLRR